MTAADFDRAITRLPLWILALALSGATGAGIGWGLEYAGGFLVGALGAYFNFRLIERAVNRIARLADANANAQPGKNPSKTGRRTGLVLLIQFGIFVLAAIVILRISGFNTAAAFCGFLVCPAAALLEIVYELFRYGHT